MRKFTVSVLMMTLLLLPGCGARQAKLEKTFDAFRQELLDAAAITFRADLTADYGSTVAGYVLDAAWDGSQTDMTIVEPALVAGVRASVRWGEGSISYDNVLLGAGPVDGEGHTPVSAVPAMLDAMAGGYTELLWWEDAYIAARLYAGENVRCTVWLDADSLAPVSAELTEDGRRVMSCGFSDWTITKQNDLEDSQR